MDQRAAAFARLFEAVHEGVYIGFIGPDSTSTIAANPHLKLIFGCAAETLETEIRPFDPDRFVGLTPQQKALSDQAWVPFGRGPHMCIGFALAQMELTLIISRIAQRLDLVPISGRMPKPVGMVVNRPEGGAPFRIRPRPQPSGPAVATQR